MIDLKLLNSMTKYPSIPTYHKHGERGRLTEEVQVRFTGRVRAFEKADGRNTRLIAAPGLPPILGTREDLLWAWGDLVRNPEVGMVEGMVGYVQNFGWMTLHHRASADTVFVLYGEFYGPGVNKRGRNYSTGKPGFCAFDAAHYPAALLGESAQAIAHWRDSVGPAWCSSALLSSHAKALGAPEAPALFEINASALPTSLAGMQDFMRPFAETRCGLEPGLVGKSEGLVLRADIGRTLAKVRFEDYNRALGTSMEASSR